MVTNQWRVGEHEWIVQIQAVQATLVCGFPAVRGVLTPVHTQNHDPNPHFPELVINEMKLKSVAKTYIENEFVLHQNLLMK